MNTKHTSKKTFTQRHLGPLLASPAILVVIGVLVVPVLYALATSFSSVAASDHSLSFNGLANYARMFSDKYFRNSLKLTVIFTVVTVFAEIVLGVAVAVVLASLPPVVIALIFQKYIISGLSSGAVKG